MFISDYPTHCPFIDVGTKTRVGGVEGAVTDCAHITPERFRELTRRMCVGVANKSVPVVRERLARLALDGIELLED